MPSVGARWDCAHSPLVLDFFCSLVYFVTPTRPPSKGILHKQFWTLQESQVQLGFFYYFVFKLFFLMEKLSLRVVAYSDCRWVISLRDPHQKGSLLTQGLFCLHSCWDKSWASLVLAQQKHPVEHFFFGFWGRGWSWCVASKLEPTHEENSRRFWILSLDYITWPNSGCLGCVFLKHL